MAEDKTEQQELIALYNKYVDVVYRICFSFMKNQQDTEDAVQETFLKLLQHNLKFECDEHVKAWLIVTASNYCKNSLKHWWRKRRDISDYENQNHSVGQFYQTNEIMVNETIEAILKLPNKYKTVVYLYYYEGYDSNEIADMLKKPASTIRSHLFYARKILKKNLEE